VLKDVEPIDRTSINAWEDVDFVAAVKATGRKKLIMAALWTEVWLVHPSLDALKAGFEVYPVVDAAAGASLETHNAGLQSFRPAPSRPVGWK
jgi:isochorismate hydrolase